MSENFDDEDDDEGGDTMFGRALWVLIIVAALVTLWIML